MTPSSASRFQAGSFSETENVAARNRCGQPTRRRRERAVLELVCAVVLATGCASAASESASTTLPTISRADWVSRANALCRPMFEADPPTEADTLRMGHELVAALSALGKADDKATAAVENFGAAMDSPSTRADSGAMERIGAQFDEVGATDCGVLFKSGL